MLDALTGARGAQVSRRMELPVGVREETEGNREAENRSVVLHVLIVWFDSRATRARYICRLPSSKHLRLQLGV
jgi:hypothetical protein